MATGAGELWRWAAGPLLHLLQKAKIQTMFLMRLKSNLQEFFSNWLYVWVFAAGFFAFGISFGWKAFIALKHNVGLNEVVAWYGRGNGNIQQYYLSTSDYLQHFLALGRSRTIARGMDLQPSSSSFQATRCQVTIAEQPAAQQFAAPDASGRLYRCVVGRLVRPPSRVSFGVGPLDRGLSFSNSPVRSTN